MARTRFPGGSEDLVTILSPHVRSLFWLKYSEADNVSEAVTDLTAICKHNGLLKELQKICPNLAFGKNTVFAAFQSINEMKSKTDKRWLIGDAFDEWVPTMTKRFRNLCRSAQQGILKKPPPSWVKEYGLTDASRVQPRSGDGDDSDENGQDGKDKKDAGGAEAPQWFYGFEKELRQAWRSTRKSGPKVRTRQRHGST